MKTRRIDALLWLLSIALAAVTASLSLVPRPPVPPDVSDKLVHAGSYAALTMCWLLAAGWRPGRGPGRWPESGPWIALSAALAGLVLEVGQSVMPLGRAGEVADAVANALGAVFALAAWAGLRAAVRKAGGGAELL